MTPELRTLTGRHVLVVEDDYFQADATCLAFTEVGAEVLGPVGRLEEALALVRETVGIDGAVLDINLHDRMVFPLADMLRQRGVPFVFATGYEPTVIPARFADVPHCQKPLEPRSIAQLLFGPA